MIYLIAAMTKDRVIGKDNKIPWYIPEDFSHFKKTTLNQTIVMGKNTWVSLPKKPLPQRKNIVLSSSSIQDVITYDSIHPVLSLEEDVYVIGGQSIYEQFMPYADELIISIVEKYYDGDTYFPKIDEWKQISHVSYQDFAVVRYQR